MPLRKLIALGERKSAFLLSKASGGRRPSTVPTPATSIDKHDDPLEPSKPCTFHISSPHLQGKHVEVTATWMCSRVPHDVATQFFSPITTVNDRKVTNTLSSPLPLPLFRNQAWSYLHRRSMRATRPRIVSRRSSNQEEESFQFMDPVEKKRLRSYLQKYYNKISRSNR